MQPTSVQPTSEQPTRVIVSVAIVLI